MLTPRELKERLTGVLPFVPTPFRAGDLALDVDGLRANLRFLIDRGVRSLGMCGFAGEFSSLTFDEYSRTIQVAVEEAAGRVLVIAGVGHGTPTAIQWARQAQTLGADCAMLLPTNIADPPEEGVYQHLKAIAQSVDIGVMLHSMPGSTALTPDVIARLADLRNVVAYKDELRDIRLYHDIRSRVGDRLVYVSANGEKMIRYYFMESMGVLATAMGNFDPELIQEVYQLAAARRYPELNQLIGTKLVPWYRLREKDRAYLIAVTKETMNLLGLHGGVPRLPLWPITVQDRAQLRQILDNLGYFAAPATAGDGQAVKA